MVFSFFLSFNSVSLTKQKYLNYKATKCDLDKNPLVLEYIFILY